MSRQYQGSQGPATRTGAITAAMRFRGDRRCPVCNGAEDDPRGNGQRCIGFLSEDGQWCHCSREEHAGAAKYNARSLTYTHKLKGPCKCGQEHGPADLPAPRRNGKAKGKAKGKGGRIVAEYDYRTAEGALLYQVVRTASKEFPQRRPSGKGGWFWGIDGVERVLYRLPELLAANPADVVIFAEGEKDVDRLRAEGFIATTNPMGASKWRDSYAPTLAGRHVVILPDNDALGRDHAATVARSLYGTAASVKILDLPDLAEKGDVSDWLDAGGTADILGHLIYQAPRWEPPTPAPSTNGDGHPPEEAAVEVLEEPEPAINPTDTGNAFRLVRRFGDDIRFCPQWDTWLIWDGSRWREDTTGAIYRKARKVVQAIGGEAAALDDDDERKTVLRWALKSEGRKYIESMIALARHYEGVPVEPGQLNTDPWALNCLNGTIDLREGVLRPHDRGDLITRLCPFDYDPDAQCPQWLRFLDEVFAGDAEVIGYVRRALGYSMGADNTVQEINIFHGDGSNGKNALLDTVRRILGDYASKAESSLLMSKRFDDHPTGVADLDGCRFVIASETGDGRRLAESLVKSLTGDETIKARRMREDFYEFKRTFKIFLATNHKPEIRGTDHGIWRRIRLVPFGVKFVEPGESIAPPTRLAKVDGLVDQLADEGPGILAWLVGGCLEWKDGGMRPPAAVLAATEEYRQEQDVIGEFVDERCSIRAGATIGATDLYQAYTRWCDASGVKRVLSMKPFGQEIEKRGFHVRHTKRGNIREGIDLRSDFDGEGGEGW